MHQRLNKKLVSIGFPTYNRAELIRQALDALLAQTYKNFELIISDNASTDETEKICKEYAAFDPRIRYIRQKENIGPVANFNFLPQESKGEYFMWASDDDLWEPDFINDLVDLHIKNKQAVITFCAYDNIAFSGELLQCDSVLFPEHENLSMYTRFKKFLLDRKGKNNYLYGIFKKKYLLDSQGFKTFDKIPDKYSSSDTLFMLEMLIKGPFVSNSRLLWHKKCHIDDFVPERGIKNFSVFKNKKILGGKVLHFIKTPYYAFFFYDKVNAIIKKSFPSFYDRYRLYFWNTYHFLRFFVSRFGWSCKLLLSLFTGILNVVIKRLTKNS